MRRGASDELWLRRSRGARDDHHLRFIEAQRVAIPRAGRAAIDRFDRKICACDERNQLRWEPAPLLEAKALHTVIALLGLDVNLFQCAQIKSALPYIGVGDLAEPGNGVERREDERRAGLESGAD